MCLTYFVVEIISTHLPTAEKHNFGEEGRAAHLWEDSESTPTADVLKDVTNNREGPEAAHRLFELCMKCCFGSYRGNSSLHLIIFFLLHFSLQKEPTLNVKE